MWHTKTAEGPLGAMHIIYEIDEFMKEEIGRRKSACTRKTHEMEKKGERRMNNRLEKSKQQSKLYLHVNGQGPHSRKDGTC